jgi:hypothetical protein
MDVFFFHHTQEVAMLDSGMVNKIYKAKQYADEPQRIHFESLKVQFDGNNSNHQVEFEDGQWKCDCNYFASHRVCCHTMAMERVLGVMLPATA